MTSIQSNTEYDYNTTTIQMGFRRKSNDFFESVSQNSNTQGSSANVVKVILHNLRNCP